MTNGSQTHTRDALLTALSNGEIEAWFQPKVNLVYQRVISVEALARWQHPQLGMLMPADFIPGISDHELDVELALHMLDAAAFALACWRREGVRLQAAVNMSPACLERDGFAERAAAAARNYGGMSSDIVLELTEAAPLAAGTRPLETLQQLKVHGFDMSLDDFGTAHSNFERLFKLPVVEVKIARSLLVILLERSHQALGSSVTKTCEQLGMGCVAEGIETAEMLEAAIHLGFFKAQGYWISEPLPADSIPSFVRHWTPGLFKPAQAKWASR
jgi:EAL domain-containing protein (putative c-di-GMP-specific phosphodiesterase class I)